MRILSVRHESWPLRGVFAISRGARTQSEVVVVEVREGDAVGRGECVPYPRYGESVAGVVAALEQLAEPVARGLERTELENRLEAGAARNALDCALWDLAAKARGRPVHELAGLPAPHPVVTAFTISLDAPDAMAARAAEARAYPLLKLKLGGEGDLERVRAVRAAVPNTRLMVDANEAWTPGQLPDYLAAMANLGVELVEQPLHAGEDAALAGVAHPVPICADESCHTSADVPQLGGRYDVVNIKLDKAGGLTEAMRVATAAQANDLRVMVGTMMGTSLLMAPAMLLASTAEWVDLDGPLWLARDRDDALRWDGTHLHPPTRALWG
ncbi:MAG: L-Ala-D/L-Glu epimerase [Gemmatimonadota bacterium]|nr:L-Ala-D/L-Glu epimerase [Gemmatimonadota bacterium]MDH4351798.1 L-Ala-D/L-Glu epimerase [Gemmatimonadota bacterium]